MLFLKTLLTGTALLILVLASSFPALADGQRINTPQQFAQAEASERQAEVAPKNFPQADLEKFANAWVRIRIIEEQAKDKLGQVLLSQNWPQDRLEAIADAESSEQPLEPELTPDERKKLQELETKANQIGEKASADIQQTVLAQGLELEEFELILTSARNNDSLRDQLKPLIQQAVKSIQSGGLEKDAASENSEK